MAADKLSAEFPILRLGLLGFSPAQQAMLETALVVLQTRLRWRMVALDDAFGPLTDRDEKQLVKEVIIVVNCDTTLLISIQQRFSPSHQ